MPSRCWTKRATCRRLGCQTKPRRGTEFLTLGATMRVTGRYTDHSPAEQEQPQRFPEQEMPGLPHRVIEMPVLSENTPAMPRRPGSPSPARLEQGSNYRPPTFRQELSLMKECAAMICALPMQPASGRLCRRVAIPMAIFAGLGVAGATAYLIACHFGHCYHPGSGYTGDGSTMLEPQEPY